MEPSNSFIDTKAINVGIGPKYYYNETDSLEIVKAEGRFVAHDLKINIIEDHYTKFGPQNSMYQRISETDFMKSEAHLTHCTVFGKVGVGHLEASSNSHFFGPVTVAKNISLNECHFSDVLHILNIGDNIKIDLKNSTFNHIIIHTPTREAEEEVDSELKLSAALHNEGINHRVSQHAFTYYGDALVDSKGKVVAGCISQREKIDQLEKECYPETRPYVLKLRNCTVKSLKFLGEKPGQLVLSNDSKICEVFNGMQKIAADQS